MTNRGISHDGDPFVADVWCDSCNVDMHAVDCDSPKMAREKAMHKWNRRAGSLCARCGRLVSA